MNWIAGISKIFGTKNERECKKFQPIVEQIRHREKGLKALSDSELVSLLGTYREEHERGRSLDALLPEVFALVREASLRVMGMRPFDVQMMGGIAMHQGRIAEMKTGEGKTLTATLPLILNALSGKGAHLVTVNDFLAKRDAEWMGNLYHFLGLTVGVIQHDMYDTQRQQSYACDITYGTNNEFGFDFLRDQMKFDLADYAQRELHYAIVDEVDSVLIDEARTPLIITEAREEGTNYYSHADRLIPKLQKGVHYSVEQKDRRALLLDKGARLLESLWPVENLYAPENVLILHHIQKALEAHSLYRKDTDYMIRNGEILIIDEFTGYALPGRRWSEGLHQAIETKEKVKVQQASQVLASISFQNYFRLYHKLAGMTGTAQREAHEFHKLYKLDVLSIPTHRPLARRDHEDVVYRTEREKLDAVVTSIEKAHEKGQPILVGTASVEKSELLHRLLVHKKLPHKVLNARHDAQEAEIVAQAGCKGAITIATNMAGRGTNIVLGGNPKPWLKSLLKKKGMDVESVEAALFINEVLSGDETKAKTLGETLAPLSAADYTKLFSKRDAWKREVQEVHQAGGLYIIGTERHDSRRIDDQLRGRSGRQGEPGDSRFYISLEDELVKRVTNDQAHNWTELLGMEEGVPIKHKWISKAIETAQRRVENHHFEIRKHLLEYDDVMNQQRQALYTWRKDILTEQDLRERILEYGEEQLATLIEEFCPKRCPVEEWFLEDLRTQVHRYFGIKATLEVDGLYLADEPSEALFEQVWDEIEQAYEQGEDAWRETFELSALRQLEKDLILQEIGEQWKAHLGAIEHLREGVHLLSYGQMDPKLVYKKEAYHMFQTLLSRIQGGIVQKRFHLRLESTSERESVEQNGTPTHQESPSQKNEGASGSSTKRNGKTKLGRNDPCWCGSGKKYKKCHLRR